MFYVTNTPLWIRMLFPSGVVWKGDPANKTVYLTFDDGPEPVATTFVLEQLEKYQVKATFFCIGNNVALHPEIFHQIKNAGHQVGNHTMNHANGWKTKTPEYLKEFQDADKLIQSHLFRPPFGRITASQAKAIRSSSNSTLNQQIIMWSVIAGDFDETLDGQQCFDNVKRNTKPGSIIVFHDSEKAFPRLKFALPATLEWLQQQGFRSALL